MDPYGQAKRKLEYIVFLDPRNKSEDNYVPSKVEQEISHNIMPLSMTLILRHCDDGGCYHFMFILLYRNFPFH